MGQNIVNLYPQANRPSEGLHDSNNYFKQGSGSTVNDKFDWRIDWAQSEKNRMFARMSDRVRQKDNPACFFCNGADENSTNEDHGFQVVLNDTYTPSPTWVIDGYAAYGRWYETQAQTGHGKADASTIGLSPSLFQAPLLPLVHSDLYATLGTDYSSFNHYVRSNVTWLGNVTKQFTRHTLKFGANYGIAFMNNRQDNPGRFDFGRSFTSCEPVPRTVLVKSYSVRHVQHRQRDCFHAARNGQRLFRHPNGSCHEPAYHWPLHSGSMACHGAHDDHGWIAIRESEAGDGTLQQIDVLR